LSAVPHARLDYPGGARLRRVLRQLEVRTEEVCRAHGLSTDQYLLLLAIRGAPNGWQSASITELAEWLVLAHNGVAERVRRAERAGLVLRERSDADRRVTRVCLTPEAERRLGGAYRALAEEIDHLYADLPQLPSLDVAS
jgi:DNA-binding MarR family transcriptional regulator